jgi:hypothetical protein
MIPPYRSNFTIITVRTSSSSVSSQGSTTSSASSSPSASPASPKVVHFGGVEHIENKDNTFAEPVSAWDDDSDDEDEPSFLVRRLRHKPSFRFNHFAKRHVRESMSSKDDSFIMRTHGEMQRFVPRIEEEPLIEADKAHELQIQNDLFLKVSSYPMHTN